MTWQWWAAARICVRVCWQLRFGEYMLSTTSECLPSQTASQRLSCRRQRIAKSPACCCKHCGNKALVRSALVGCGAGVAVVLEMVLAVDHDQQTDLPHSLLASRRPNQHKIEVSTGSRSGCGCKHDQRRVRCSGHSWLRYERLSGLLLRDRFRLGRCQWPHGQGKPRAKLRTPAMKKSIMTWDTVRRTECGSRWMSRHCASASTMSPAYDRSSRPQWRSNAVWTWRPSALHT